MPLVIAVILGVVLAACANPVNQRTAERYYAAGERALDAGALPVAKENFSRALVNAKIGRLGPVAESEAAFKLAQVLGNMCEYDEAESMFLQALASQETAFGVSSLRTVPTRIELAQFNFDVGRYEKATKYFERAFEVGGEMLGRADPSGYARLLDDYSVAQERAGNNAAAAEAKSKARAFRANIQSSGPSLVKAGPDYVPYPKSCK